MSELSVAQQQEKKHAALTSVIAAVGLTSFKIVVGALTGSLGILAEAAHSALDLVAALVTFLAVRISGKPADEEHHYGHGKVENLSALFETLLLLATCVWIIYEAIQRLFFKVVEIEVSVWAFVVMVVSIIVDVNRSRMLYAAARKHNSQALEADALHFSTDIWSSSVVILGLTGVWISERVPQLKFLQHADAVAALGVAVIVIFISMELGIRTVKGLMDTAPQGAVESIKKAVEEIPGVINCHQIRVRSSGAEVFVDCHVVVSSEWSLQQTHDLADQIEAVIQQQLPGADVTVHPEPGAANPSMTKEAI